MAVLVLLTGLPGIGKTTVATGLPQPFYERIHFGGILRQIVEQRLGYRVSHEWFRRNYQSHVDACTIELATAAAADQVSKSRATVAVLDSHAVTPTVAGLRVTPDSQQRLNALRLKLIVHLRATTCRERVVENSRVEGRLALSDADVAEADYVQVATDVLYASACDCALTLVSAAGSAVDTVARVDAAVQAGLRWSHDYTALE